jgi:GNAT superfamily N-acetyltransferase
MEIEIVDYIPEYAVYFDHFNRDWLEERFSVEPIDKWVLENPEEAIMAKEGKIYFAMYNEKIIGTVAVMYLEPGIYELTKMAVDKEYRGIGAGKLLCQAAIDCAINIGAKKLILYSQTGLKAAIGIYFKLGFIEMPLDGKYKRADIKMQLDLN